MMKSKIFVALVIWLVGSAGSSWAGESPSEKKAGEQTSVTCQASADRVSKASSATSTATKSDDATKASASGAR